MKLECCWVGVQSLVKKCSSSILAARLLVIHCKASSYGSVRCLTALNRFQSAIQTTSSEVERTIKLF